jgi:hypothetical protein
VQGWQRGGSLLRGTGKKGGINPTSCCGAGGETRQKQGFHKSTFVPCGQPRNHVPRITLKYSTDVPCQLKFMSLDKLDGVAFNHFIAYS